MEIEPSPSVVAKKLWNIVRVLFIMMRKGLSKSKIMVEFHLLMKRGKLAGKAMANNFFLHHYSNAFSCRSNDAVSFVSPREYEFSCSNSPANGNYYNPFVHFNTKRNKHHHHGHSYFSNKSSSYHYDDVSSAVQKVLEMYYLNNNLVNDNNLTAAPAVEASPLVTLPGFGKSPLGIRQLRITDSPFPLNYEGGDSQVDAKAESFITEFYKKLKSQRRLESPSPCRFG